MRRPERLEWLEQSGALAHVNPSIILSVGWMCRDGKCAHLFRVKRRLIDILIENPEAICPKCGTELNGIDDAWGIEE